MVEVTKQAKQTMRLSERIKNLLLVFAYLFTGIGVVLYGLVFTTNLLTQLHFANGWFYLAVGVTCYALMLLLVFVLIRKLVKAFNRAFNV